MNTIRRAGMTATAAALCVGAFGCQAMYFLTPNETKDVKAEYAKLSNQRIAVLVWADRTVLDVYPRARRRVCDAVLYDLKKHIPDAIYIRSDAVEKLQESSGLDWEHMSNAELVDELRCDLLLRIDLLEFTTRSADTRELRKGRVQGSLNLYERGPGVEQAVYSTDVLATYPSDAKAVLTDLEDEDLLREATSQFGQTVGQKFYDHKVSLRGREAK